MKLVELKKGYWVNPDYVKAIRTTGGGSSYVSIEGEDSIRVNMAPHSVANMLNHANDRVEEVQK